MCSLVLLLTAPGLRPAASGVWLGITRADALRSTILLTGGQELDWPCGTPFHDPGFIAYGREGEDLSAQVRVRGTVTPWRAGDYELSYQLSDEAGEIAEAVRHVHVFPVGLPDTQPTTRSIYLTFDDGPCEYTQQVLDILDKYDVKATFFVVGRRSACAEMLPRIAEAGHTLGIHCYSHNILELYQNENTYFSDLMHAQEIVHEYTGEYASVIRLPGGSRTAASFFAGRLPGRMEEFDELMHNMGLRYYDWNIQPESVGQSPESTLYVFTHPKEEYDSVICLQHDTRGYSVSALEQMIQWGLDQGYTFLPIDTTTPEVHAHIVW